MLRLRNVRELEVSSEYLAYSEASIKAAIASPKPWKPMKPNIPEELTLEQLTEAMENANGAYACLSWGDYLSNAAELLALDAGDQNADARVLVCKVMMSSSDEDLTPLFEELMVASQKTPEKSDIWVGLAHIKFLAYQFDDSLSLLSLAEKAQNPHVAAITVIREKNNFGRSYISKHYNHIGYYFWADTVPEWYKERLPEFDYDMIDEELKKMKAQPDEAFKMAVNNPDLAAFFTAIEDLHTEVTIVPPSLYTTPTMTAESAPILKLDEKSLVAICDLLDPASISKVFQSHPSLANIIGDTQLLGPLSTRLFGGVSNSTPWNAIISCETIVQIGQSLLDWTFENGDTQLPEAIQRAFGVFPRDFVASFLNSSSLDLASTLINFWIQNFWVTVTESTDTSRSIKCFQDRFDLIGLCLKFQGNQHLTQSNELILLEEILASMTTDTISWQRRIKNTGVASLWKARMIRYSARIHHSACHALLEARHLIQDEHVMPPSRVEEAAANVIHPRHQLNGLYRFAFVPVDYEGDVPFIDLGCMVMEETAAPAEDEEDEKDESKEKKAKSKGKQSKAARADVEDLDRENDEAEEGEEEEGEEEEEEGEDDEEGASKEFWCKGSAFTSGQSNPAANATFQGRCTFRPNAYLELEFDNFDMLTNRTVEAMQRYSDAINNHHRTNETGVVMIVMSSNHLGYGGTVSFGVGSTDPKTLGSIFMWRDPRPFTEELLTSVKSEFADFVPDIPEAPFPSGGYAIGIQSVHNHATGLSIANHASFFSVHYSFLMLAEDSQAIPDILEEASSVTSALRDHIHRHPLEPAESYELRRNMYAGATALIQSFATSNRYMEGIPYDLGVIRAAFLYGIYNATREDLNMLGYFAAWEEPERLASAPDYAAHLEKMMAEDPYTLLLARLKQAVQNFADNRTAYLEAAVRVLKLQLSHFEDEDQDNAHYSTYRARSSRLAQLAGPSELNPDSPVADAYYKWIRRFYGVSPALGAPIMPMGAEELLLYLGSIWAQHSRDDEEEDEEDDDMPELEDTVEASNDASTQLFVSALKNKNKKTASEKSNIGVPVGVAIGAGIIIAGAVAAGAFFLGRILANKK